MLAHTFNHPLKICIATSDFVGPIRNGGIGTIYTTLAHSLSNAGHQVTILYLQGQYSENESLSYWIKHYEQYGIQFIPLPTQISVNIGPPHLLFSYLAYLWLRDQNFDVIHFHEWLGFGYFSTLAKHQGLEFQNTSLCVGIHSPSIYLQEANAEFLDQIQLLENDYMEKMSVAYSDMAWSPSRYLLDWVQNHEWTLPERTVVIPHIFPKSLQGETSKTDTSNSLNLAGLSEFSYGSNLLSNQNTSITEIIFFGRLQEIKGLRLFCDAMDLLAAKSTSSFKVTFLGKPTPINGKNAVDYIQERSACWPFPYQIISNLDQSGAVQYLNRRRNNALAVIPSLIDSFPFTVLECLNIGIPFIASRVGGIPEQLAAEDIERTCFLPRPLFLAEKIVDVFKNGTVPPKASYKSNEIEEEWLQLHQQMVDTSAVRIPTEQEATVQQPLVSVCITHYNRPEYLLQAIQSIVDQDYPNIELVIVDDGSTEEYVIRFLDKLKELFINRNWKVIRQDNKYLGAARNNAAKNASGEYILFMDDDNYAKTNEISIMVDVASRTKADIVTCFMDVFSGENPPIIGQLPIRRGLFMGGGLSVGFFHNDFGDANSLIKREVFLQIGGFTEDYGVGFEDWELFSKASLNGLKIEVIPEALYWYRSSQTQMSINTQPYANYMRAIRPYLESVPSNMIDILKYALGAHLKVNQLNSLVHQLVGELQKKELELKQYKISL